LRTGDVEDAAAPRGVSGTAAAVAGAVLRLATAAAVVGGDAAPVVLRAAETRAAGADSGTAGFTLLEGVHVTGMVTTPWSRRFQLSGGDCNAPAEQ
jgi:hypothetical protein